MNGPGKSDKPIVPAKPAKSDFWDFCRKLFEPVEGRGLAKDNEQDENVLFPAEPAKQVDRTQSRVEEGDALDQDLPSALDRIRQAACRDKEMKFTALWHHVYKVERLREASRKEEAFHPSLPTSTCTTCLTCGLSTGERRGRKVT